MATRTVRLTLSPQGATGIIWMDSQQLYTISTVVGRLEWEIEEDVTGGGYLTVTSDGYETYESRCILPLGPNELVRELPDGTLTTDPLAMTPLTAIELSIRGDKFYRGGKPWVLAGSTELQLAARVGKGENIQSVLDQRKASGANLVRVLGMHEGAGLFPTRPDYDDVVKRTLDAVGVSGLVCLWCCFAGTKQMMPQFDRQLAFWFHTQDLLYPYRSFTLLDLGNEVTHQEWQEIDPSRFPKPYYHPGSSGSGLTDEFPPGPQWDFRVYHARRTPEPPGAKPFNNCNPYEFHPEWPHPVPFICEESVKPHNYGFSTEYARKMAQAARLGPGMVFHTEEGVYSQPWPGHVEACARTFFDELGK